MTLHGSGKAEGTLLPIKCTYPECKMHFTTAAEMKRHKHDEPQHDYCKKCDVDCKDWEDFLQHKINAMIPWLSERTRPPRDEQPKHIVCEFCGEDFKSFGGRKEHRAAMHKADQNIKCPGCERIFVRAGLMVAHLERGQCVEISEAEYVGHMQHKHIVREIMRDPFEVTENLRMNKALTLEAGGAPVMLTDGSEMEDQSEGGVPLIDEEDQTQSAGPEALKPEFDLIDLKPVDCCTTVDTGQLLPGLERQKWNKCVGNPPPTSPTPSVVGRESACMSDIMSRCGSLRVATKAVDPMSPRSIVTLTANNDASNVPTTTASPRPSAWSTGISGNDLLPHAISSAKPGDWSAIAKQREDEVLAERNTTNLLHLHFWNPSSRDYEAARFFNTLVQQYCCPFPECGASYDAAEELSRHFREWHMKTHHRCPTCLRMFGSAAALTSHMEDTVKCRVRASRVFERTLDEVSGGFLSATRLREPKIHPRPTEDKNAETSLVRMNRAPAQAANGVMDVRYDAQLPFSYAAPRKDVLW